MAEYSFSGETTELVISIPDEAQVDRPESKAPEWAVRILDAWLHGKLLDFEGCTVPREVQEILYRHFWAKHKLGVCSTCTDEYGDKKETTRSEEGNSCDASCVGTDCVHQRERRKS